MVETSKPYDDKLALILRSAAAVFAQKGYHQASIRDISRATGVSLSGLYYYFRSKEELLFQIQHHCFRTVLENAEELVSRERDPERSLRLFIEAHLRYFVANMDEMKVLSHEAESLTGEYGEKVAALKRRYTELCANLVAALAPERAMDQRVATFALFGMMNWIYNWYRPERDVPVEELAADVSRLFLRGYLSRGAELPEGVEGSTRGARPSIWRR